MPWTRISSPGAVPLRRERPLYPAGSGRAAWRRRSARKDNAEIHVEEGAGHAFHNRKAPMFHMPAAAARAWHRTEEFLQRHLPTRHKVAAS